MVKKSSVKVKKIGKVKKEELVGKGTLQRTERIQTCPALRVHIKEGMSQSCLNYYTHALSVIAYNANSQIECKTLFVLPSKSQAQILLLCRYFRKRVVIMKHHPYRSPLRKYLSPKKGSPGRKLTFTSPQKATPSPTSSPICKSISQQVTQQAGRSPQKGTLSPNKFTNMQETLEELNSCHEGRYKVEVTKLKTITLKVCSNFLYQKRKEKEMFC